MVLPSWFVTSVAQAKFNADLGPPAIEQLALAEFISSGRFGRHLRRNRAVYK
jgi:GntR family transcriptional regulator/MocR family aminotransferase